MTPDTTTRPDLVLRYPIVSFYILAFALGAGTIYLVVQEVIPASLALGSVLSASVAGVIMTAVEDGRSGLKLMLSRLLIWRVGIGYWFFTLMFLLYLLPWSIFFNWVFNNTKGSLLLVAILHGSEVWAAYWVLSARIDQSNLDNYWGYGAVLFLIAIMIVIMTDSQNLSRKHKRIVHQPRLDAG